MTSSYGIKLFQIQISGARGSVGMPPFPERFYQLDVLRLFCRPFLDQNCYQSVYMLGCSLMLYNAMLYKN